MFFLFIDTLERRFSIHKFLVRREGGEEEAIITFSEYTRTSQTLHTHPSLLCYKS